MPGRRPKDSARWHGREVLWSGCPSRGAGWTPSGWGLAEGVAEHYRESVGIGCGQALNELVTVFDKRGVPLPGVFVQGDPVEGKGLHRPLGDRHGGGRRLHLDESFGPEGGAGNPAGHGVCARLQNLIVVPGRRPDHTDVGAFAFAAIHGGNKKRQAGKPTDRCVGLNIRNALQPRRQRALQRNGIVRQNDGGTLATDSGLRTAFLSRKTDREDRRYRNEQHGCGHTDG